MNAAETVNATIAVLAQNQGKPFVERMRLLEEEVRPLSVRIAEAMKRGALALLVLLMAGCSGPAEAGGSAVAAAYMTLVLVAFGLGLLLGQRSRDAEVQGLAARLRWVEFERDVWRACSRRIHSNAKGQRDFFAEAFGAGGGDQ